MINIELNLIVTVGLAIIVIFVGKFLVARIGFLRKFLIPYPVVGGLVFAFITLIGHMTNTFSITMNTTLQSYFMVLFFTTVGFTASLKVLKEGGKGVVLFLIVSVVMVVLQDAVGALAATLLGQNPLLGLATGSIPMTGGHGTSGAFGPVLEQNGLTSGTVIAIAAATFGLISGSLLGGPTARSLIKKYNLRSKENDYTDETSDVVVAEEKVVPLDENNLCIGFFQVALAAGIGFFVTQLINMTGFVVPEYLGGMIVAAVMRNVFKDGSKMEMKLPEISSLGSIFLAIFLAHALMGLRLWELADLAIPLIILLLIQVIMMALYARFVTFRVMGKDYDAAVLAAGHCGFGLGATPNAMANMNAVTSTYGPSTKAFFILPIIGSLFIDFINAGIITAFIQFLS